MPPASPEDDQTSGLADLLDQWQSSPVVMFPRTSAGDLDDFFRLRLLQVVDEQPPLPALSVIVVSADRAGRQLAGGFADRFRFGWPFARCVFLTEHPDHAALSAQLGVPIHSLNNLGPAPEILASRGDASQKIAVQMQRTSGGCGNTILFENQVEDLVRAGFLTIRVFADATWRRGATLRSRLDVLLRENSPDAGAHINVIAVPDGPPVSSREAEDPDEAWQHRLSAMASCSIRDPAVVNAAEATECVIANHIQCVGPAIALFPRARLLLALHEDRAAALRQWATLMAKGNETATKSAAAADRVQRQVIGLADMCAFLSLTEMNRLAQHCRASGRVMPRPYTALSLLDNNIHPVQPVATTPTAATPRFDLLLVGSENGLNVVSLRWFLERVWRPFLEPHSVSVAIVGRAGVRAYQPTYASPLLHFLGFVEDLEAVRSSCRMSVVPDVGGAGISIKLLTALAAGHPLATTQVGLRGLDPSLLATLPASNVPEALAADIRQMIDEPARLDQRRALVRKAWEAMRGNTDHAQIAMAIPRPTAPGTRKRLAQWARIVGDARVPEPTPYIFKFDAAFPMSGTAWDRQVLRQGWHEPEPWGRWTDGADATLRILLAGPTNEPLTLELDVVPSAVGTKLLVDIDGMPFPLIDPVPGPNRWDIPPELSAGKSSLLVSLHAAETVCPARTDNSPDDRILGIGVSAVRLLSRQPTLYLLTTLMPIKAGAMPSRVLLTGWHKPEHWGCWTNSTTASFRLTMIEPLQAAIRLELNIALPRVRPPLTLSVNGVTLPAIAPTDGVNSWDLPLKATNRQTELLVTLMVPRTFCGAAAGVSNDDRELGVGLRGVRLVPTVSNFYEPGTTQELCAGRALDEIMRAGWHPPEEWGCWTSQRNALLRLTLRQPMLGPFRLEMDLAAMPVKRELTLVVNGQTMPPIVPLPGINRWSLPERLTDDQHTLFIGLQMSDTFCPAEVMDSADKRIIGLGVRRLTLHRETAAVCPIGTVVRLSSDFADRGMLLAGWHKPEPWGCWSSGSDASMLLRFDAPLQGAYALEFEMTAPLLDRTVTLAVNDTILETVLAVDGRNQWTVPRICTDGQTELNLHLLVLRPARPSDVSGSKDDRILGVGVASLLLRPLPEA